MILSDHARLAPDKPVAIGGATGRKTTWANLERRSNQVAHALRGAGLRQGDRVGLLLDNHPRLLEVQWAALRSGLRALQLDPALGKDEVVRVGGEARVKAVVASGSLLSRAPQLRERFPECKTFLIVGGASPGWESYESALGAAPGTPVPDEAAGEVTYVWQDGTRAAPSSSPTLRSVAPPAPGDPVVLALRDHGFDEHGVLLVTAPLWRPEASVLALAAQVLGGTTVIMETFDARESLRLIERYRVTHGQWRNDAFAELLELPQPIRQSYDVLSMRCAMHGGPPLDPAVIRDIREWWGSILHEHPVPWTDDDTTLAAREALRTA